MFSSSSVVTKTQRCLYKNKSAVIRMGFAAIFVFVIICGVADSFIDGKSDLFSIVITCLAGALCLQFVYGIRYAVKQMIETETELSIGDCFALSREHFGTVFVKNIILIAIETIVYRVIHAICRFITLWSGNSDDCDHGDIFKICIIRLSHYG